MTIKTFTIEDEFPGGIRIDKYLPQLLTGFTRSQLKQCLSQLIINDKPAKPSRKVFPGDQVTLHYAELPGIDLKPETMPLVILYENDDVIILDKPQGLVVHPGSGNSTGTLVHGLLAHYASLAVNFRDTGLRPGIVHRLDKDTSGIIITAKNVQAHEALAGQFRDREVKKTYLAVLKGILPKQEDTIDIPVKRDPLHRKKFITAHSGGKKAVTCYRLLKAGNGYSLVMLKPQTGRTHQLRVHMKHIGCPVLGDPLYSRQDARYPGSTLMLHACELVIRLPGENAARKFSAPLPDRFRQFFKIMGWDEKDAYPS